MDLIFFFLSSNVSGLFTVSTQLFGLDKEKEGDKKGLFALIARRRGYLKALPKGFRDMNESIDGFCKFDIRAVAEIKLTKLVRSFIDR